MKKLFTLALLSMLFGITADAQNYRKWDFTNWSPQTVANLAAEATKGVTGGTWSDTEKADGTNPQIGKCYWSYGDANVGSDGLMANGALIGETEGLVFNPAYVSRRSLAIAVDYPSTSLGEYAGPQYLWLGGGNAKSASARIVCFTIPKVKVGQKITFVAESHKPSDARGVALFVGSATDDANRIGEAFTPREQDTYTWENWTLPEGAEAVDGMVDILVYNTNGCHIYSIEVGDPTEKSKVAYLFNGTAENELAYKQISANEKYAVEAIECTAALTVDQLSAYDAVVLSATLTNADAIASLKDVFPFVPTLNLNPALYAAWGYGEAKLLTDNVGIVALASNKLLAGITPESDGDILMIGLTDASQIYGVKLGEYFADDIVPLLEAVDEGVEAVPAAHIHNINHNGYIYLPFAEDATADAIQMLNNAVSMLAGSKAKIAAAPKPTIKLDYKDQNTDVIITSTVPRPEIFYTIDGSEPTVESTPYTEPFNISTTGVTVKAVVRGEGYLLSEVAEKEVDLKNQAAAPTIAVTQVSGGAVVSLDCATEGVRIYYNYSASADSTQSSKYTEPFTLMTNQTITAFAVNEVYVQSELAQQEVTIDNPLKFEQLLSHMDANKAEYYQKFYDSADKPNTDSNSKVAYFFSWGKNKASYPYYDTTAEPISTTIDIEGNEVNVYPKNPEEKYDFENGWAVRSRGHVICEEITIKPGKDIGNGSTYNPASVGEFEFSDYPVTDFYLNISEWNTANPRSGMIYSTQKFKGPFAVLSYISNGNSGTGPMVVFETGQDIEGDAVDTEWKQMGDTCNLTQAYRLYRKFVRIYDGTDEVYLRTRIANGGSKAGFYDIYVLQLSEDFVTGISNLTDNKRVAGIETVYSINGARQNGLRRGVNIVRYSDGSARKVVVK